MSGMSNTTLQRSASSVRWDQRYSKPNNHKQNIDARNRYWVYDPQIRDFLPKRRPCDYCDTIVYKAFTCDACCDRWFDHMETNYGRDCTDLLLVAGIKNRVDVLQKDKWAAANRKKVNYRDCEKATMTIRKKGTV